VRATRSTRVQRGLGPCSQAAIGALLVVHKGVIRAIVESLGAAQRDTRLR
jgi:hypothetical protein